MNTQGIAFVETLPGGSRDGMAVITHRRVFLKCLQQTWKCWYGPCWHFVSYMEHPIHFNRFPPDPTCRTCFRKRDQREQQGALIGSSCFRTCCAYTNATHQDLIAHLEMLGTFVHQALSLRKIHRLGSWHGEGNQVEREREREREGACFLVSFLVLYPVRAGWVPCCVAAVTRVLGMACVSAFAPAQGTGGCHSPRTFQEQGGSRIDKASDHAGASQNLRFGLASPFSRHVDTMCGLGRHLLVD